MTWQDAASAAALTVDEPLGITIAGTPIALFRMEDGIFALHDLCPHGRARLSEGYIDDECVECPLHQGLVDIRTGAARSPPIEGPTRTYPARIEGDRIQVDI